MAVMPSTLGPLSQRTVGAEDMCVGRMNCRHAMPSASWDGGAARGHRSRACSGPRELGVWAFHSPVASASFGSSWGRMGPGSQCSESPWAARPPRGMWGKPGPACQVHEHPSLAEFPAS